MNQSGTIHALRIAVLVSVLLSSHATVHANIDFEIADFGAKTSLSLSGFHGNDVVRDQRRFVYKPAPNVGAFLRIELYHWLAIQPEFSYKLKGAQYEFEGAFIGSADLSYIEAPIIIRLSPALSPWQFIRPYLALGASPNLRVDSELEQTDGSIADITTSRWDVSIIGRVGIAWSFSPQWTLTFETSYERGLIDTQFLNNDLKNHAFLFTIGIAHTVIDSDSDGFTNSWDQCPNAPEDRDSFEDYDGCPDNDNDNDNIVDNSDITCPNEPEDIDGYQDNDGCPDTDSDRLADWLDGCPGEPEDRDYFQDYDGCPDPDNDNDGILDNLDECPNTSGFSGDGPIRPDGCPVQYDTITVTSTAIKTNEMFAFAFGSAILTRQHRKTLKDVAKALKDYPQLRLRIEAHADSSGVIKENKKESQYRANAVRKYLMGKPRSIDGSRLVVKALGDREPLNNDDTEAERQKNRRVEFIIIPE